MKFEWDIKKEDSNIKKHRVDFTQAKEALTCGLVIVLKDDFVNGEQRYVFLGKCKILKILVVVVAYPSDEATRIISARKANKKERSFYETQL